MCMVYIVAFCMSLKFLVGEIDGWKQGLRMSFGSFF